MKNTFNRFAIRFLEILFLGFALLAFRSAGGIFGIFAPRIPSAWELSKLEFWPLLAAILLTGPFTGSIGKALREAAPWLVAAPLFLMLAFWGISRAHPAGGIYLVVWLAVSAAAAALSVQGRTWKHGGAWLVIAAVVAAAYILFSFLPPCFGPFLDSADAAAMATIPC
ncbi:MAG: hypothetical protein LKJ86_07985 [Oscillibacter sp.]|jgi:hypothetical protein|nr:hypothetical protein [Oscillibacter sp.]